MTDEPEHAHCWHLMFVMGDDDALAVHEMCCLCNIWRKQQWGPGTLMGEHGAGVVGHPQLRVTLPWEPDGEESPA